MMAEVLYAYGRSLWCEGMHVAVVHWRHGSAGPAQGIEDLFLWHWLRYLFLVRCIFTANSRVSEEWSAFNTCLLVLS